MSYSLIPTTKNPIILHLCRDIIRKQEYEIWEMEMMKKSISDTIFSNSPSSVDQIPTKLEGQALHAIKLSLKHPISNEAMDFEAPLPNSFLKVLAILRK